MNASLEPNWVLIGCFIIPLTWLFHYQLEIIGGSQSIYRTGPLHSVIVSLYHKLLLGALPIVLLLYISRYYGTEDIQSITSQTILVTFILLIVIIIFILDDLD